MESVRNRFNSASAIAAFPVIVICTELIKNIPARNAL